MKDLKKKIIGALYIFKIKNRSLILHTEQNKETQKSKMPLSSPIRKREKKKKPEQSIRKGQKVQRRQAQ